MTNAEENNNRNSVPILSWDFHYERVNELKSSFSDFKKVKQISTEFNWDDKNLDVQERLKEEVVVITDLEQKIVFASTGIKKMTGYAENEILGKTPKIFQGPDTSEATLNEIREAIKLQIPFEKTVQNYKKNGKVYDCRINGLPVFNLKGKLSHFIAFEREEKSR